MLNKNIHWDLIMRKITRRKKDQCYSLYSYEIKILYLETNLSIYTMIITSPISVNIGIQYRIKTDLFLTYIYVIFDLGRYNDLQSQIGSQIG